MLDLDSPNRIRLHACMYQKVFGRWVKGLRVVGVGVGLGFKNLGFLFAKHGFWVLGFECFTETKTLDNDVCTHACQD